MNATIYIRDKELWKVARLAARARKISLSELIRIALQNELFSMIEATDYAADLKQRARVSGRMSSV
jgi:hypothetical protein